MSVTPSALTSPLSLSILSATSYAGWVIFSKLASNHLKPQELQLVVTATAMVFSSLQSYTARSGIREQHAQPLLSLKGVSLAIACGFGSFVGTLFFTKALRQGGDVAMVSAISGCYPAVAFVFSVIFLGDDIKANKVVGLLFAVMASIAFAYEPSKVNMKKE